MNYKQSFLTKEGNIAYKMTTAIHPALLNIWRRHTSQT